MLDLKLVYLVLRSESVLLFSHTHTAAVFAVNMQNMSWPVIASTLGMLELNGEMKGVKIRQL